MTLQTQNSTTASLPLFDLAAAVALRDEGIAVAAENAGSVVLTVQEIARELGRRQRFVTADDVQRVMAERRISSKELGNGAGSMFRARGEWRKTMTRVNSVRIAAHCREIPVWEYVDQMIVKGILDQQREARKLSRGEADRPLWEKHKEQERQALVAALAERSRLDPDAPAAIVFKESSDNSQLSNTQNALRNLYKAVQKSRAVNDPLGMATAMEEAGKWF